MTVEIPVERVHIFKILHALITVTLLMEAMSKTFFNDHKHIFVVIFGTVHKPTRKTLQ